MPVPRDRSGHIPTDHYVREDVLARELEQVFKPSWLCVGFTDDLTDHNDFITAEIGRHGIVVQNFQGEIRAFRNVCSHRFSRIQCEPKGNRPLMCPYHGWSYDASGVPDGIPFNAKCFGFDEADRKALALESYAVETCGRFVFVRMAAEGPSLQDFLGHYHALLLHLSGFCFDRYQSISEEWPCNWKTGLENAAEGYHVPLLHPDTLGGTLVLDEQVTTEAEHSYLLRKLVDRSRNWWATVTRNMGMTPSTLYAESDNFVIFPNIVMLVSAGVNVVIQTIEPIDAGRLRFNSTAWLAANRGGNLRDLTVQSLLELSRRIIGEDRGICTHIQNGMRDGRDRPLGIIGEMENRIGHFQQAYARRMGLMP